MSDRSFGGYVTVLPVFMAFRNPVSTFPDPEQRYRTKPPECTHQGHNVSKLINCCDAMIHMIRHLSSQDLQSGRLHWVVACHRRQAATNLCSRRLIYLDLPRVRPGFRGSYTFSKHV